MLVLQQFKQVLERCCALPVFDPNAQHCSLLQCVGPMRKTSYIGCCCAEIKAHCAVLLVIDNKEEAGVVRKHQAPICLCVDQWRTADVLQVKGTHLGRWTTFLEPIEHEKGNCN